ncbi:MAG TPA: DUF1294 domain-containing protein [Nitrososphaerales archaeon]|nr:DUF1294 domain-containing protein [Nitrososphaerales archaeon]HUK74349.1 DUF1294 domain-containing protein [Nitrososphaerales archaeon]
MFGSFLVDWVLLLSAVGLVAMGVDKLLAMGRLSRIRERTLWIVSLLGGFLGIIVGGWLFHHKTSKTGFWVPVLVTVVLWAAIFWYAAGLGFRLP